MSDSLPSRRTPRKPFLLSFLVVVALSSFRLWNDVAHEAAPPADTMIVEQPFHHVNKVSPFWGAFPNVTTTDRMETFSNLSDLVQFHNLSVPHNLNILIMGDSLSRYQYLDLVYFLSHNGTWPSPDDTPNMVVERTHRNGWVQFYNFTNAALHPYEQCDCFRRQNLSNIIENRYYHDPSRNNTVTYLQKFGSHPFKSSWNVSDIHETHALVQEESDLNFIYQNADWVDTIRDFVCHMSPKPSLFIFNSGLWPNNDLKDVHMHSKIIEALQACQIGSMFKTTTKSKSQLVPTWAEYERQLCNLSDHCMDVRWTALVPEAYYWDKLHFREPVYSMLNVQLLSLITSHENFPDL